MSIMPETGYKITESGLFMMEVRGVALRAIENGFKNDKATKDFFTNGINSSQVLGSV